MYLYTTPGWAAADSLRADALVREFQRPTLEGIVAGLGSLVFSVLKIKKRMSCRDLSLGGFYLVKNTPFGLRSDH